MAAKRRMERDMRGRFALNLREGGRIARLKQACKVRPDTVLKMLERVKLK